MLAYGAYPIYFKPLVNAFNMESMEAFQTSQQQILTFNFTPIGLFKSLSCFLVWECFFCKVFGTDGAFLVYGSEIVDWSVLLLVKVGWKDVQLSLTQAFSFLHHTCHTPSPVTSFSRRVDPLLICLDSAGIEDRAPLLYPLFNHIDESLNLLQLFLFLLVLLVFGIASYEIDHLLLKLVFKYVIDYLLFLSAAVLITF